MTRTRILILGSLSALLATGSAVMLARSAWIDANQPPSGPAAEAAAREARAALLAHPVAPRPDKLTSAAETIAWLSELGQRAPANDVDWIAVLSLPMSREPGIRAMAIGSLPAFLSDGKLPGGYLPTAASTGTQEAASALLVQLLNDGPPDDLSAASACFVSRVWMYRPEIRGALLDRPATFQNHERLAWGYTEIRAYYAKNGDR